MMKTMMNFLMLKLFNKIEKDYYLSELDKYEKENDYIKNLLRDLYLM